MTEFDIQSKPLKTLKRLNLTSSPVSYCHLSFLNDKFVKSRIVLNYLEKFDRLDGRYIASIVNKTNIRLCDQPCDAT